MKKKTLILFALICACLILPLIQFVKATDYEWIQNGGFENVGSTTAYYNVTINGQQYVQQEWTENGDFPFLNINDGDANSISTSTENNEHEHFSFEDLPSTVTSVNNVTLLIYARVDSAGAGAGVTMYMQNDTSLTWFAVTGSVLPIATYDYYTQTGLATGFFNTTNAVDNAIIKFKRTGGNGVMLWITQVILEVGVTINTAQTDIDYNTLPFYSFRDWGQYEGITDAEANSGTYSGYIINTATANQFNRVIVQDINYLLTDNLTSVSLYAKTNSDVNVTVQFVLIYSDYTSTTLGILSTPINSTMDWTQLDYSLAIVPNGKLIRQIIIEAYGGTENAFVYIDDVSIIATIEDTGTPKFNWYLAPEPYEYSSNFQFIGYTGQDYIFYGEFYDSNGTLTEDGSFSVSMTYQSTQSGSVVDGQFNFNITARAYAYLLSTETITITLTLPSGIYRFYLYAVWNYGENTVIPTPLNPNGGGTGIFSLTGMTYWIVYFFIIIAPAVVFAIPFIESNRNPIIGIILGLFLSTGITVLLGFDIWATVLCIVAIVVIVITERSTKSDNT